MTKRIGNINNVSSVGHCSRKPSRMGRRPRTADGECAHKADVAKRTAALRVIQHVPGAGQQVEAETQEHVARDMKRQSVDRRYSPSSVDHRVTRVLLRHEVEARILRLQPNPDIR